MKCLECQAEIAQLDNSHLGDCCGLTLQEYAIRHHLSLDLLVHSSMVNVDDDIKAYSLPNNSVSSRAASVMKGLSYVDALKNDGKFISFNSDIRRLDELLWYLRELQVFGFQYRQEYQYTSNSHRVVPLNVIKTLSSYEYKFSEIDQIEIDFELFLSVIIAQAGEMHAGYVYLTLPATSELQLLLKKLASEYQIRWKLLESKTTNNFSLYRTESLKDAQRLLALVEQHLKDIPCISDRYYAEVEQAVVSKELVFDAAHFITDHPGKCENLHGGRYTLNVKIKGRIDPLTGFVVDYGYLKKIVKERVIESLDHQNLNYVSSDLGWRSSTELLNIFIWERLIDYLPGLVELQTFETTQSYCVYQGPSLEEFQQNKNETPLKHFANPDLGQSVLRKLLGAQSQKQGLHIITK